MNRLFPRRLISTAVASLVSCSLLAACGGGGEPVAPTVPANAPLAPTPNATETARRLIDTAESEYMAHMTVELHDLVRSQPWFGNLTQDHVDLIAAILRTERAAKAKGEADSIVEMLTFASEQGWYGDGLEIGEARGLRGAFEAYEKSLTNKYGPTIGPVLATTLEYGLFEAIDLEGGELIVVVSADDPEVGRTVIEKALNWLPQIEELVGPYPYSFLHLMVTDIGEVYAGLSYDEFIAIAPDYVDDETIVHELTHSTMYGSYPAWFEEGFAYFVGYYMTDTLEENVQLAKDALGGTWLYVGAYRDTSDIGFLREQIEGMLFMNGVYEINGIDALIGTVRQIRTKSLSDQELLRTFVSYGTGEEQRRMEAYFCENVVGTSRNYCPPEKPF
ncbi:MAG TPA: hypothetical protein VFS30_06090 [Dehalococcoidia bacterium]|nr:hypothetical protein [Dehalococcoidia bacterium]